MRWVALLVCALAAAPAGTALADRRGAPLTEVSEVARACGEAATPGRRSLLEVTIPSQRFQLASTQGDDGLLTVDLRRNLRALGGKVELFPARLEPVGFIASAARATELQRAQPGARLRVGFFLGFDGDGTSRCLVRPFGITTVRFDLAYLELVSRAGEVLAREETERLRAWLDDPEQVSGPGPHATIEAASLPSRVGPVPEGWQRALRMADASATGRALARCQAEGVDRGASPDGRVVVRLRVDAASGGVAAAEVELSSMGDAESARCIARALGELSFPPLPGDRRTLELSVPVRLSL